LASTHNTDYSSVFKLICPEVNNKEGHQYNVSTALGNFRLENAPLISFVLINASSALALSK
jgi:hypothetical protein